MLNIKHLRQTPQPAASISTDTRQPTADTSIGTRQPTADTSTDTRQPTADIRTSTRQPTADTSRDPDGNRHTKQQFPLEKIIKKNTDIARFFANCPSRAQKFAIAFFFIIFFHEKSPV